MWWFSQDGLPPPGTRQLVGSNGDIAKFEKLVPAPSEAYTQLFWAYNTEDIDRYIADRYAKERARRGQKPSAKPEHPQQFDLFENS